jgi:hypothetical protein
VPETSGKKHRRSADDETTLLASLPAKRRCVVFCDAASSLPSTVRTATLVFVRKFRRLGRASFVAPQVAWTPEVTRK